MKWKKWAVKALAVAVLLTGLAIWLHWENQGLAVTEVRVDCRDLPEAFSGYRIAQISDLHNTEFGEDNQRLLTMLRQTKPDIIVITGDLVDSRKTNLEVAVAFGAEAAKIAPTYYVTGNHEERMTEHQTLLDRLEQVGVILLENKAVALEKDGQTMTLIGIRDPGWIMKKMDGDSNTEKQDEATRQQLEPLMEETREFTMLLAHRPGAISVYADCEVDLVFSGHLHGGQFRIPYVGGVVTLVQGLLSGSDGKFYDAGLYEEGDTQMIVSRGLGNSVFPFRINNKPEIVLAELHKE